MKLRKHQGETDYAINGIINKHPKFINTKTILMSVVAGGGKGSVVVNAGKLLKAGLVDRICSIVPRKSLQTQCEEVCMDPFFKKLFNVNISIRASTNEWDPCRGLNGFATTYQALGADKNRYVLREIKSKRYCVILDEFHHVELDSPWHAAVEEIIKAAEYVILMSGTLSRSNKKRIACVKYNGGYVDLDGDEKTHVITYSRSEALREKAILPIEFHLYDSSMSWRERDSSSVKNIDTFNAVAPQDRSKALYTALNTEFFGELMENSLHHWLSYKQNNPRSKILFVCAGINEARQAVEYLNGSGVPSLLATSHESKECVDNINKFKHNAPVLVTIAVAYEGLDVPPISHVCILTRIRSNEWLEQCVSRATRYDKETGPYHEQAAYIFAPQDQGFLEFVDAIKEEQTTKAEPIRKIEEQLELFPIDEVGEENGGGMQEGPCIPLGSQIQFLVKSVLGKQAIMFEPSEPIKQTPKQNEKSIRRAIDFHLKKYAQDMGYEIPHVNREAKKINGKPRGEMTLYELEQFLGNIKKIFPLSNNVVAQPSNCPPIYSKTEKKLFDINRETFF